ncbi:type IV pilin protein [Amphritea pacifica]|uniref:Type IV pilin protein n=1 Tax=Amphritea pacifica TaxID=2811233 RepID=A0ABS2WBF8_9GAMM|nr:type IV pilin protein [Amphritea pacifica]MBN0989048.1 type IV pilin protein [Amphritea pacifica]
MRKMSGFTLIELMIAVAILGILLAIAYPSLMSQVRESRRSDGYAALMSAAAMEERFFTVNNQYTSDENNLGGNVSEEGFYSIDAVASGGGSTFTITAVGLGSQANDTGCTTLVLSHTGEKTPADCW